MTSQTKLTFPFYQGRENTHQGKQAEQVGLSTEFTINIDLRLHLSHTDLSLRIRATRWAVIMFTSRLFASISVSAESRSLKALRRYIVRLLRALVGQGRTAHMGAET